MKHLKTFESIDSKSVKISKIVDEINDIRNEFGDDWELEAGELLDQLSNMNYEYSDTEWDAIKL